MDAPQPSPEPRGRRDSGSVRAIASSCRPYLIHLLWLSAGWLGAQTILPGPRISRLEAEFRGHMVWAGQKNSLLEALATLACIDRQGSMAGRNSLRIAKVPCGELLGNQVPAR